MKRVAHVIGGPLALVAFVALLAGGCAGVQSNAPSAEQTQKRSAAEYVNQVETQAVRRGFHVTWVNPPRDR